MGQKKFEKITTMNFPKLIEDINDLKTSENPKRRINTHTHTHTHTHNQVKDHEEILKEARKERNVAQIWTNIKTKNPCQKPCKSDDNKVIFKSV